ATCTAVLAARRGANPASTRPGISTPAKTRAAAPSTSTRSAAGAGRRRAASSSRCSAAAICASSCAAWWTASYSSANAPPACAGARGEQVACKDRRAAAGRAFLRAAPSGRCRTRGCACGGRPAHLQALALPLVLDKPGVGENLQDHLQLRLIYKVAGATTLNETYHSRLGRARMALDYALFRRGPLTMAPSQLGLFTRSDP